MDYPHTPSALVPHLSDLTAATDILLRTYAWMHLSRQTDNRILELFRQGLIKGTVTGGQGNEGLIVPLALLADKSTDVVSFTHRDLGGHLIWSGHLVDHLNQYCANAGSPTKAREGNIHHGDPAHRSLPMISHLGAMLSTVIGRTDAQRRDNQPAVGFAFFGDGGSSTGDIHESMNLASLLNIPVVFVIEHNQYAYSTPCSEQYHASVELFRRAAGYGMEGIKLDTTDVAASLKTFSEVIAKVRTTGRPMLVECRTLRLRGHAAYDTCDYLPAGKADEFTAADGLPKLRATLASAGLETKLSAIETENVNFVEACIKVALATPRPTPGNMAADLFAPAVAPIAWKAEPSTSAELTMAQAVNLALRKVLSENPKSMIMGQDIGVYGGAFKVTDGLLKDFGRTRVFNTPLAESACTGYAIGMALGGYHPIEEFQFSDFATEAATQLTQNAATMHFRSGAACPITLRLPCGGGLTFGSFHSQELESFWLSIPGIKAIYPSTPQDAFNATLAAAEEPNPVMIFEHKGLYRKGKQNVKFDANYRTIWSPKLLRAGDFATVVTYGEMTQLAAEACEYFAGEYEKSFELFDLRCLSPMDLTTIRASLSRTHRLIVIHEGRRTHGFGAELVAQLTEGQFFSMEAPPLRIASMDLPVPFAPELESVYRPTKDKIISAIAEWIK